MDNDLERIGQIISLNHRFWWVSCRVLSDKRVEILDDVLTFMQDTIDGRLDYLYSNANMTKKKSMVLAHCRSVLVCQIKSALKGNMPSKGYNE